MNIVYHFVNNICQITKLIVALNRIKCNENIFRASNSSVFYFAAFQNGRQLLKDKISHKGAISSFKNIPQFGSATWSRYANRKSQMLFPSIKRPRTIEAYPYK